MENKNAGLINAFKIILFVILICVIPISVSTIINKYKGKNSEFITKKTMNAEFENFIKNNSEFVLRAILDKYFEIQNSKTSNVKINNAIWLFENEIFNKNLPQYGSVDNSENSKKPKVMILFSDFDIIKPIFDQIFNFQPNKLNAQIYFRQIITQSKYSANLAAYAIAIYHINKEFYLPFYIDILSVPKKDLNQEKIESIIKSFGLDVELVKKTSMSDEIQNQVKSTDKVALDMKIDQLPAFIFENGLVFFGHSGLKIVKNLYKTE